MDVSALSLGNEESLLFEEVNQQGTGTTGKIFLRFDGPIELRDLDLSPKVNFSRNEELPFDTHFDLPWNVRIRFSAGVRACEWLIVCVLKKHLLLVVCVRSKLKLLHLTIFDGITIPSLNTNRQPFVIPSSRFAVDVHAVSIQYSPNAKCRQKKCWCQIYRIRRKPKICWRRG